jgi:ring-1,2-phenylacetyl-CoA epoxidase subunit PaaE
LLVSLIERNYQALHITNIRQETNNVKTFVLEPSIPYKAGQFLTFVIDHHGKEERRSFSISSSPEANEPLTITVKRVDNGIYSRLLIDRAKAGDELYTSGAGGLFVLPDNISLYEQVFFFAAGIGITPVFSLIKTLLYTQPLLKIMLVYSNRNIKETVFYDELRSLQQKFSGSFKVEFLFSSSFDLSRARLSKQLLPVLLNEYAATTKEKMLFYTCGPFSYMRMVLLALEEQNISVNNVKKENFNTEVRPLIKAIPPDILPHKITVNKGMDTISFLSQYPSTILQAAKKNGYVLPYSCETGRCGSCAVKCVKGNVWMSNNEVLTAKDIEKQLILTCVGYPINGDIELDIH